MSGVDPSELAEAFAREHEARYGYRDPDGELELVGVRVAAAVPGPELRPRAAEGDGLAEGSRRARFGGEWLQTRVLRGEPPAGFRAEGPCVFELPEATLVLPAGWAASVDEAGTIEAGRGGGGGPATKRVAPPTSHGSRWRVPSRHRSPLASRSPGVDPVTLQVLAGGLRAACEEMGAVLIRSAHSSNIKERHDCSTALFDPMGELIMQAEHIPVHLGSMPAAVAAIVDETQAEGDLWVLNDPYRGGTHLPDVTLISPVFAEEELIGFAASRAHHADIGGETPGGMPAFSTRLEQEGVVIPPTRADDEVLRSLAERMRNPDQRLADFRAQRAANLTGITRMRELYSRHGREPLREGMAEILDYAERRTRAALAALPDGDGKAVDRLEAADGTEIVLRVRASIRDDALILDFEGTDPQAEGNLNCPISVTWAACSYAVRVVCDPDAPPSAGAWRPVELRAPEGSLLNARPPAAVTAGNVETSGRVADLVIDALGAFRPVPAQGQGTMNNFTLADDHFTYYETICGGQGACPDTNGPSAIHVAMSNTLNTPVEALETEFPLRVRELSVLRGSGGEGLHSGGDGIAREIEALAPMHFTLISERRRLAPRGREGGEDGRRGRDALNGESIPGKTEGDLRPGDRLRIETPGGGGWGRSGRQATG